MGIRIGKLNIPLPGDKPPPHHDPRMPEALRRELDGIHAHGDANTAAIKQLTDHFNALIDQLTEGGS